MRIHLALPFPRGGNGIHEANVNIMNKGNIPGGTGPLARCVGGGVERFPAEESWWDLCRERSATWTLQAHAPGASARATLADWLRLE